MRLQGFECLGFSLFPSSPPFLDGFGEGAKVKRLLLEMLQLSNVGCRDAVDRRLETHIVIEVIILGGMIQRMQCEIGGRHGFVFA